MSTPIELFTRGDLQTRLVTMNSMNKNERIKARDELCLIINNCKNDEERIQIIEGLKKQFGDNVDVMYFINEVLTVGGFLTEKVVRENAGVLEGPKVSQDSDNKHREERDSNSPEETIRKDLLSSIQDDGNLMLWDFNEQIYLVVIQLLRENHPKIINLDFRCLSIDDNGAEITAALHDNTILSSLKLRGNRIRIAGARAFAALLYHNTSLTSLDLRGNKICAPGAKVVAAALRYNTSLTSLDLRENKIGADGIKALAATLPHSGLTHLNLFDNRIGKDGLKAIIAALLHNTLAIDLVHEYEPTGAAYVKDIASALGRPLSLTSLNLGGNSINPAGATALAVILRTSLITLRLDYNPIGPNGAKAIAAALRYNTSLTSLGLENNGIGTAGVRDFTVMLRPNTSLSKVWLEHNHADAKDIQEVTRICDRNERLALNWGRVAILTAFTRANSASALRDSVFSLIRGITNLARGC